MRLPALLRLLFDKPSTAAAPDERDPVASGILRADHNHAFNVDGEHTRKTRVFVSYSRADMAFVDQLVGALDKRGYEVLIDRQNLPSLEDWRRELLVLVRRADSVVFVVSPHSIASSVCAWEVEQVGLLDKRLAPVVLEPVDNAGIIPEAITRINYLFFNRPGEFESQADALATALQTDIRWWHEHTRLVELAERWEQSGRPEGQLLRLAEVSAAQAWANRRPAAARIPPIVFELTQASLAKEDADRQELDRREQRISDRTQGLVANEVRRAREAAAYPSAMRIALAGEPTASERARGIASSRQRQAELAAAAQASRTLARFVLEAPDPWRAALSPEGKRIALFANDDSISIRDTDSGAELRRLAIESGGVAIAFGFGEKVVAACAGHVAAWDLRTGSEVCRWLADTPVDKGIFSQDRERLVAVSGDTACVVDLLSGAELCRVKHAGEISGAGFSPDNSRFGTAGSDHTARIWDIASGAELFRFEHKDRVNNLVFSADGRLIVTASDDNTARIWDTSSGAEKHQLLHGSCVATVAFSPTGNLVLTTTRFDDGRTRARFDPESGGQYLASFLTLYRVDAADRAGTEPAPVETEAVVWSAATGAAVRRFEHQGAITAASFSADGARVLTASNDETVVAWDFATGGKILEFQGGSSALSAEFSLDSARIVAVLANGSAHILDAIGPAEHIRLRLEGEVAGAVFSPDDKRIATAARGANPAGRANTIELWDAESGACLYSPIELSPYTPVESVVFSQDGAYLATACNGHVQVWDSLSGRKLAELHSQNHPVFSPNGTALVTSRANVVHLWETGSWSEVAAQLVHQAHHYVKSARFSVDGGKLVTSCGVVAQIWDVDSRAEAGRVSHDRAVNCASFDPCGAWIVTGSDDRSARIWNARSCTEVHRLEHNAPVVDAHYNPGGERLLTASGNAAVLWDASSASQISKFEHQDRVNTAVFSSDGGLILTASDDGQARVWDATWVSALQGDSLVQAVSRTRLLGDGVLTQEELLALRPLLGEIDPDVVQRWLERSPSEARIDNVLAEWRRRRTMSLALSRGA